MISYLNVAVLPATDPRHTAEFLVQGLGFEKKLEVETAPGRWWHELVLPGGQSAVAVVTAPPGYSPPPGPAFTFCCDDVAGTVAELRAAGVDVSDPVTQPWGTFAQCTDPDGHLFVLGATPLPTR